MLGQGNYIDLTGQMEDVFDSKIQQINFLTEDNVKDKIEEAVAEIEIKPELFDDIYSKIDHTHTNFNNDLTVNGTLTTKTINNRLTINGDLLRFWNPELLEGNSMYFQIGKNHDNTGDNFWIQYTKPGKMYFKFYPPGIIMMEMDHNTLTTTIYNNLNVSNLNVNGMLNGYAISGDSQYKYYEQKFIPTIRNNGIMEIGKYIDFHDYAGQPPYQDYNVRIENNREKILMYSINASAQKQQSLLQVYGDIELWEYASSGGANMRTVISGKANGSSTLPGNLNINGDLYVKGVKIDGGIHSELTVETFECTDNMYGPGFNCNDSEFHCSTYLNCEDNGAYFGGDVNIDGDLTVNGVKINSNQTITHQTDDITGDFEIGTFCETNGGIYTGYDKIDTTDCICQVQQSNTLNPRIVGIITGSNQFASHGDVLVKIVPGTYHLGDILCPDITGKARKATDTELQYMMLHAIPRPKITSLEPMKSAQGSSIPDTKIEGTVACFIV